MKEEWKPVVGFEDAYEISNLGKVRSIDRTIKDKNGKMRFLSGKPLHHGYHSFGYPQVMLGRGNARRIYNLVAETFLGPRPAGMQICHKDGDVLNGRVDNLYYGTAKQNQADRILHGTACIDVNHPMHKVTKEQVDEIRSLCANDEKQQPVADRFGITQSAVSMIVNGRIWK